jgi:hypothetical protein
MNDGRTAARIAREAARGRGTYFTALSAQMCWDAVAACQNRGPGRGVTEGDPEVTGAHDVRYIPEGASIGFFDGPVLVHEMISTGNGLACGNKNACIGMGNPVGWEELDLCRGNWQGSSFGPRGLTVRYRRI